jgi:hypothetical protein
VHNGAVRREPNSLEGATLVVERVDDLTNVPARLRDLVTAPARSLFEGYPGSLERLAARTKRMKIADALTRLARSGRCELEIHRPGRRGGGASEVYVRVGEHPVRLSGSIARPPARCPPALAEVLRLVGVVRAEYGFALGLLAPADQIRLSDLARQYEGYYPGALAADPACLPRDPSAYFAVYENSGAYVCTNRNGRTWSFSLTGGDYGEGPSIASWLDRFFEAGPFGPTWPVGN